MIKFVETKTPLLKNNLHTFLLFSLIALQIACASKKNIIANEAVIETLPPKLIFLNYSISKDVNGKKSIEFIKKIITDGKLKNNTETYLKTGAVGDLKCSQLSKDSVEITSIIVKNPLSKIIEYVNDSLIFESKKIDLQKTAFTLRLQLHSKTVFIAINEVTDSLQNSKSLIITKLD